MVVSDMRYISGCANKGPDHVPATPPSWLPQLCEGTARLGAFRGVSDKAGLFR